MLSKNTRKIISLPYQLVHSLRKACYSKNLLKTKRLPLPVISVGNISFGGTGKTPFTIYLAKLLSEKYQKKVCILTRGYGARIPKKKLPLLIKHSQKKQYLKDNKLYIGDEPKLIIDKFVNNSNIVMSISSDRYGAAVKALEEESDIDIFLLDDGMQHLGLYKDFEISLVNISETGFYREFSAALKSIDIVVYSKVNDKWLSEKENQNKIGLKYKLNFSEWLDPAKGVLVFSGLADNQSFFENIRAKLDEINFFNSEAKIDFETLALPDHYELSKAEIENLISKDQNIICTEKDLSKIPSKYHQHFISAELDLEVYNEGALLSSLDAFMSV